MPPGRAPFTSLVDGTRVVRLGRAPVAYSFEFYSHDATASTLVRHLPFMCAG